MCSNLFNVINKSVECAAEKGIQASFSFNGGLTAAGKSEAVCAGGKQTAPLH